MNQKTFSFIAGIIFALVSFLHLSRIIFGWEAVIGGWTVPLWISWPGAVVSGFLAYQGFKFNKE